MTLFFVKAVPVACVAMAESDPTGPEPSPDGQDGGFEAMGMTDPVDAWENPTMSDGFAGPMALGFPDRREERDRCGLIRFKLENGVPDVGG